MKRAKLKTLFRLRGEFEGTSINAVVADGQTSVGAHPRSDLVLPSSGVSRNHAVLEFDSRTLTVIDSGSKNGTFVNRNRVDREAVSVGDRIHFGPVGLVLEEVEADDVIVGLALSDDHDSASGPEAEPNETLSLSLHRPGVVTASLGLLHTLIDHIHGEGEPELSPVLELLRLELSAEGIAMMVIDDLGTTGLLATSGTLPDTSPTTDLGESITHAIAEDAGPTGCTTITGAFSTDLAWARTNSNETHVLLVSRPELHASVLPMLEVALRLLVPRPASSAPGKRAIRELDFPSGFITGSSPAIQVLYSEMAQLVPSRMPVLIVGETGVGKELVARTIHRSGARRTAPYSALNCAAIPAELLEAELFGIERGVATGVEAREGTLIRASGGIVLLDEIGDMSPALQAKLLRALQEKEVTPVGAHRARPIDIRVLAATNVDLKARIADGSFRRDLYYRIAGATILVPPLRERREDIPALIEHFMRTASEDLRKPVKGITAKALRLLVAAPWPGNIRQLEHEVHRLISACRAGTAADSSLLSAEIIDPELDQSGAADFDFNAQVEALERRLIAGALERTRWNQTRAAELLGISRNGIRIKMERYGLRHDG